MSDVFQITLRTHFQTKGKQAFQAGRTRDSHGLNHDCDAIADFFIGYDAAARTSPAYHTAPAGRQRVEQAQGLT